MSEVTKKKRIAKNVLFLISWALTIVPSALFIIEGFYYGETKEKICIGFVALASIILGVFMVLSKANLKRTIFWIVMLGCIAIMDNLRDLIIIMGACNIADEILISPLHNRFKEDYHTNKQIDKREKINGEISRSI